MTAGGKPPEDCLAEQPTLDLPRRLAERNVLQRMFGAQGPSGPVTLGRYQVVEALAAGSFGTVYLARDPRLGRDVALKVFSESGASPRRIEREAHAVAAINHPNVVTVHDVGVHLEDGRRRVYMVMELLAGITLADWIREGRRDGGSRSHAAILRAFAQAGRGLAAAHAAGLLHRDFKPANIMISPSGHVSVVDFGLARARDQAVGQSSDTEVQGPLSDEITQEGSIIGTPAYLAPECLRGEAATERSDQFGFAASLYFGLCGRSPYEEPSKDSAAASGLRPEALAENLADVRAPVRRALIRALSEDPQHRFPSVAALLDRVEPRRRRRLLAPSLALAGVGAVAVVAFLGRDPGLCDRVDAPEWSASEAAVLRSAADPDIAETVGAAAATFAQRHTLLYSRREQACVAAAETPGADSLARLACLERLRGAYEATRAALAAPATSEVRRAAQLALELEHPDACGGAPPPASGEVDLAVENLIGEARALRQAGRAEDALARLDAHPVSPGSAAELRLALVRAQLLHATGRYGDARAAHRRTAALAEAFSDNVLAARVLLTLSGELMAIGGDTAGASLMRERALARLPPGGLDASLVALDARLQATLARRAGNFAAVVAQFGPMLGQPDEALEPVRDTIGDFASLASASSSLDDVDTARRAAQRALDFAAEHHVVAPRYIAICHTTLARIAALDASQEEVLRKLEPALQIARNPLTEPSTAALIHHVSGGVMSRAGALQPAIESYRQSVDLSRNSDGQHTLLSASSLADLGGTYRKRGELDAAESAFRESVAVTEALAPDSFDHALSLAAFGQLLVAKGELRAAIVSYDRALASPATTGNKRFAADVGVSRQLALAAAGDSVDCTMLQRDVEQLGVRDDDPLKAEVDQLLAGCE